MLNEFGRLTVDLVSVSLSTLMVNAKICGYSEGVADWYKPYLTQAGVRCPGGQTSSGMR